MPKHLLRQLPPVNDVLNTPILQTLLGEHPRHLIIDTVREELDALREQMKNGVVGGAPNADTVGVQVAAKLQRQLRPKLRRVINATGIVLHTNLGRAPLAVEAAKSVYEAAHGYLNLELDLDSGKRSSRQLAIREWVCRLTGAESATAVNNNAAATVITLRALCQGKEVIISRGQLIEIGGSFRIPEIMAVSGATLREVGTTNITRLSDYENAIGPSSGALMQVHTSNYRVSGFTKSVAVEDLVALGRKHNLPVIDDVGSGALIDFNRFGFTGEPVVKESIAAGVDLVLFSGDKLLGGPQAGIIAGRMKWIQQIEKDPLMRAFRLDKMTLAALETTLRIYLDEAKALQQIPVLQMLSTPLAELRRRAESLAAQLRKIDGVAFADVAEDQAYVGGGSLPDQSMPSAIVELGAKSLTDEEFSQRLRLGDPAVMARVRDEKIILDVRTVFPEHEALLIEAVQSALSGEAIEADTKPPSLTRDA